MFRSLLFDHLQGPSFVLSDVTTSLLVCFVKLFIWYVAVCCLCVCVLTDKFIRHARTAKFFAPVQTGPGAYSTSCTMGTGSFPGGNSGRGVTLTPHSLLVPWSRNSRAIPLFPLWAVRPVQSLSACTMVHFTSMYLFLACPPNFLPYHDKNNGPISMKPKVR